MFRGNYNFFDYKYNISGYNGQDFGSFAQYLYLVISFLLLIILCYVLHNLNKDKVHRIIRFITIFLVIFYIIKTTWESIYDIRLNGSFNSGLLPLDMCSMIMYAGILASFSKGKIKEYAISWIMTGSIIGSLGTMFYLTAFNYYPFLSFGAFYSMIWHFLMLFMGVLLIVTNYGDFNYKTILKGFIVQLVFSLIVIPIDFIFNLDFMFYKELGSIPIFNNIGSYLVKSNLAFINPIIMLCLYFFAFNILYLIVIILKKLKLNKKPK